MQRRHRVALPKFLVLASLLFAYGIGASAASKYKLLHSFGNGNDGAGVDGTGGGPMTFDNKGNLYGTGSGGAYGLGVVFEFTP
jgi:hypothetical protein